MTCQAVLVLIDMHEEDKVWVLNLKKKHEYMNQQQKKLNINF